MIKDKIGFKGTIEMKLTGPDGIVKQHDIDHNALVLIGFDEINTAIRTGSMNAITHLGIGWGTGSDGAFADSQVNMQATDALPTSGQDRIAPVITKVSEKVIRFVGVWNATEPVTAATAFPIAINEVGLFWNSGKADDEMLSRYLRSTPMNKDSADILQITYTITMTG